MVIISVMYHSMLSQEIMLKIEEEKNRCIEEDLKQEELKREMEIKVRECPSI